MCSIFMGSVHVVLRSTHVRVDLGSREPSRRGEQRAPASPTHRPAATPAQAGHLRTRTGILSKPGAASIPHILPLCTDLSQCRLILSHPIHLSMPRPYLGVKGPGAQGLYPPTKGHLSFSDFSAPPCPGSRAQTSKGRTTSPHPYLKAKTAQSECALCPMRISQLAQGRHLTAIIHPL